MVVSESGVQHYRAQCVTEAHFHCIILSNDSKETEDILVMFGSVSAVITSITLTLAHAYAYAHAHTHTHVHAHAHAFTRTHTHKYTKTQNAHLQKAFEFDALRIKMY